MRLAPILPFVFVLLSFRLSAQTVINAYAKVTNVSGTTISLSDVDETYDTFEAGQNLIIMQMQGDVLGSNTGNNSTFGNLSAIGSAGLYEDVTIASVNESLAAVQDIWYETFEDQAQGNTSDAGATSWSRTCGTCTGGSRYLEVRTDASIGGSLLFAGNRMSAGGTWTSGTIDIARYQNVSVSATLAQTGFDNGSDNITLSYSIDGGSYQTVGSRSGNFTAGTETATGLSGSSLVVRIVINGTANGDIGMFDNVLVQGQLGTPTSIVLASSPVNSYLTGTNASVQVVSFPEFVNYTTTADLTALPWNGSIGGVFAIDVTNTLTLANNISTNGQGFKGGAYNPTGDGSGCDAATFITSSDSYARKGEGVYKVTDANYQAGRGKVVNGGGGGNFHNAGGGGGGNYTVGGEGGPGWNGTTEGCTPTAGGLGGIDLSDHISASRIFMGGGGGGGQQNNNVSFNGGDGGGIIIVRAGTVQTNGGCGGLSITADGDGVAEAGNDGGAGAGAGGSIVFQVNNWALSCQLTTTAAGGAGGSVNYPDAHGGGGGGGKGVIIFSGGVPTTNFTYNNNQGTGGANGTNGSAGTAVQGGTTPSSPAADSDGIVESSPGILPVELLEWRAIEEQGQVVLWWITASEQNNHFFTIERSSDGKHWNLLQIVEGSGTTDSKTYYDLIDESPLPGTNYYRLSQTDYDGSNEVFDVVSVSMRLFETNFLLYPNPNNGEFNIKLSDAPVEDGYTIQMFDVNGRLVEMSVIIEFDQLVIDAQGLPSGYYILKINLGAQSQSFKVIIN